MTVRVFRISKSSLINSHLSSEKTERSVWQTPAAVTDGSVNRPTRLCKRAPDPPGLCLKWRLTSFHCHRSQSKVRMPWSWSRDAKQQQRYAKQPQRHIKWQQRDKTTTKTWKMIKKSQNYHKNMKKNDHKDMQNSHIAQRDSKRL